MIRGYKLRLSLSLMVLMALARPAPATWSIVVVDTHTREVGIGSATCLEEFNLRRFLPVVVPMVGVAAAQSSVDVGGVNRVRIWNGLRAGDDPNAILAQLSQLDAAHQSRQYGIVDTRGRALTFTGTGAGAFAGGVVGRSGTLVYAIQGNVITGQPVIDQAEAALLATPGDMAEKLMAAMEAARDMGGDGRCSCGVPTACGAPPPSFVKSAHVGFVIVGRRGDGAGTCSGTGCATGPHFLAINISGQDSEDTDPDAVDQLRVLFDAWATAQAGGVDAIRSQVVVSPPQLATQSPSPALVQIQLLDRNGAPHTGAVTFDVSHDAELGSAAVTTIGTVQVVDAAQGRYALEVSAGMTPGRDLLRIAVTDAAGTTRVLMPSPAVRVFDQRADLDQDGDADPDDLGLVLVNFAGGAGGDADGDGDTDLDDLLILLASLGG